MTLTDAIFGPLTGTPQVEFAVLDTLEAWVPFMLKVLERRLGVQRDTLTAPPGRNSYRGGIDLDSWEGHCMPNILAVVKPTGEADRNMGGYSQMFEVTVAPVVDEESEDEARILCGHLATAVMASIAQHGSLGGVASNTTLVSAPVPEFPDPARRTVVRAPMVFSVYVEGLVDPLAGTGTDLPPDSPQFPDDPDDPFEDWPEHLTTTITYNGTPTTADVSSTFYPPVPGVGAFRESVETLADLPTTGNIDGDVRLVRENDVAYVWSSGESDWDPLAGSGGPVDTSTLVGFCLWNDGSWTYDGEVITVRPSFNGILVWAGGGTEADPTPEGLAITRQGDFWLPSGPVD